MGYGYVLGLDWDYMIYSSLGGLEHLFFHILGTIIPTDELICFRRVGQPPTSSDFSLAHGFVAMGGSPDHEKTKKHWDGPMVLKADSAGADWIRRDWFLFTPSVAMN